MLPASDEDIYISMKYCSQGEVKNPEIYRSSYITGPSKPKLKSKHKPLIRKSFMKGLLGLIKPGSLEEKLTELAEEYNLNEPEYWRIIDKKAYNRIMMCRQCRKDHKLRKYYHDLYHEMVKPVWGIEEQEEEDVFEDIKRGYFSRNGEMKKEEKS